MRLIFGKRKCDIWEKKMSEENMIYLMNLFTIKGAHWKVRSRKEEVCYEKVSTGIGSHEASSSAASSRRA